MEFDLLRYKIVWLIACIVVMGFLAAFLSGNVSPVSAVGDCAAEGWFCGIDEGYGIVVDRQGWQCLYTLAE